MLTSYLRKQGITSGQESNDTRLGDDIDQLEEVNKFEIESPDL